MQTLPPRPSISPRVCSEAHAGSMGPPKLNHQRESRHDQELTRAVSSTGNWTRVDLQEGGVRCLPARLVGGGSDEPPLQGGGEEAGREEEALGTAPRTSVQHASGQQVGQWSLARGQAQHRGQGPPPSFQTPQHQFQQRPVQSWQGGGAGQWSGSGGRFQQEKAPRDEGWKRPEAAPREEQTPMGSKVRGQQTYPSTQLAHSQGGWMRGAAQMGGPLRPPQAHPGGGLRPEPPPPGRAPSPGASAPPGQKQAELREERRVPEIPTDFRGQGVPRWHAPGGQELGHSQNVLPGGRLAGESGPPQAHAESSVRENLMRGQSAGAWFLPRLPELAVTEPQRVVPSNAEMPRHQEPWQRWAPAQAGERKPASETATWQQMVGHDGSWRAQPSFPGASEHRPPSSEGPPGKWANFPGFGGFDQPSFGPLQQQARFGQSNPQQVRNPVLPNDSCALMRHLQPHSMS
jgi:hypothetical protein